MKRFFAPLGLTEQAQPSTPPVGVLAVYAATDGTLHVIDSDGVDTELGPAGSVWHYGTGEPDDGGGEDGDMYLQDNGNVWQKQSGTWVFTGITLGGSGSGDETSLWMGL